MKQQSKIHLGILALAFVFLIGIFAIMLPDAIAPNVVGPNYKNLTLTTKVNITHSKPDVLNVTIYDASNLSVHNITVNAGAMKRIICNATVRSWEGFNDFSKVNATLYHMATSGPTSPDNNNSHYSNVSCKQNASLADGAPYTGWFACGFDVWYYANNGTWVCNITASNSYTVTNPNFTGVGWDTTYVYPVYAINVTDGIDYGGIAVEDYSTDKVANLTNLGNMNINISVEGYGVSRGDGLAMNCTLNGNITVDNEKFSASSGQEYGSKTSLVGTAGGINIPGLTMPKQTNSTIVKNSTYWQLYVPPNPAGNCTGYIIFTATSP